NILYPYNTNNNTISNKLYTYINILLIYYSINTVTWLFSALFHIRDIYITQCVDYFSAILSLFTSIAISLYRLYLINTHYVISLIWFIHVLYMLTNFNFMYNSIICGIFYCINVLLWYNWYVFIKEYSYSRILVLIISGMCISVLFQVIDFGPIYFLLDSHAVWHILGFIFSTFLYVFIIIDLYYIKDILYNV
ncbi:post-GPI attachment to proteins factor 3, partial [Nematocida sp. AWRm79]